MRLPIPEGWGLKKGDIRRLRREERESEERGEARSSWRAFVEDVVTTMTAAGWQIVRSSDGTTGAEEQSVVFDSASVADYNARDVQMTQELYERFGPSEIESITRSLHQADVMRAGAPRPTPAPPGTRMASRYVPIAIAPRPVTERTRRVLGIE